MPKTRRELCTMESCNIADVNDFFENRLWYSQSEVDMLKKELKEQIYEHKNLLRDAEIPRKIDAVFRKFSGGGGE